MRRFGLLREELRLRHIDQATIGARLGLTQNAISMKMTGRAPWTMEEAYIVTFDILGFDNPRMVPALFPHADVQVVRR